MPAVTTRASKAVLKARAARDLRNIDGDAAVFRIEEAERRRMVAKAEEQYKELIAVVDEDEWEQAQAQRTPEKKLREMSTYSGPVIEEYKGHLYDAFPITQFDHNNHNEDGDFLNLSSTSDLFELDQVILARRDTLTGLDLNHSAIDDISLKQLCDAAKRCKHLHELHLGRNIFTDDGVDYVCGVLNTLDLHTLDVGWNRSTSIQFARTLAQCLVNATRPPTKVRVGRSWLPVCELLNGGGNLDFSADVHQDLDGAFIAVLVSKGKNPPHTLCLDGAPLPIRKLLYGQGGQADNDDNGVDLEIEAEEESAAQARDVHLRGGYLQLEDLSQADSWLVAGTLGADLRPGLRALTLDGSAVHASGCEAIGEALRNCRALRVLHLNSCQLTNGGTDDSGVRAIAYSLREPLCLLAELEARENDIDEAACKFIADALLVSDGLRCLDLRDNPIDDKEGGKALEQWAAQSKRLVALNGIDVTDDDVDASLAHSQADGWQPFEVTFLCSRLKTSLALRTLNLDSNDLGPIHLEALARGLDVAEHIRVISLRDNKLQGTFVDSTGVEGGAYDTRGVKRLAKHLAERRGVRSLDMRGCHLDDRSGKDGLAKALYEGTHALEHVDWIDLREGDGVANEDVVRPPAPGVILDAKGLTMCQTAFLARGLRAQPELVAVEAPGNGVCVEWSCRCLAEALMTPKCQLVRLVLNKTILRVEGAVPLFEALKKCTPPLEVLELSHAALTESWIGYNRERSLAACLECASALTALKCNLKQLVLDFNELENDGLQIIAHALERNSSLDTLGLRSNKLSEGTELGRMLRVNKGLTSLDLSRNQFTLKGPDALVAVANGLVKNRALRTLDLTGSGVDSASGPRLALLEPVSVALAYCLDENPVLKQVRL